MEDEEEVVVVVREGPQEWIEMLASMSGETRWVR
jgi:hypothetical protein